MTQFGSEFILLPIAMLVFVSSKYNRSLGVLLVGVVLLSDGVVFALRLTYVEPRPFQVIPNVVLPVGIVGEPSFPSGHATRAFAFAAALTMTKGKRCLSMSILAVAVGLSRVALGVHYPLDVVAGAFLGIVVGILFVVADRRLHFINALIELSARAPAKADGAFRSGQTVTPK